MGYCKNISKIWECDFRDRCIFSKKKFIFILFHQNDLQSIRFAEEIWRQLFAKRTGKVGRSYCLSWEQNLNLFLEIQLRSILQKPEGGFATEAHRKTAPCIIFERSGCGPSSKRDLGRRTFCQTSVRGCVMCTREVQD